MKKIISLLLAIIFVLTPASIFYAEQSNDAVLNYSFESSQSSPSLFGNAQLVYDDFKGGKVLSLDGTNGTFAELPQGFFDGKSVMTISFDVLARNNSGNYFTFTFGKDNEVYNFFRIRDDEIRNAITRWSYPNENEVRYLKYNSNIWMNIAIVYNFSTMKLYVNGEMVAENNNSIDVSDLGSNLLSYFGKSLYNGDGYFNGCFDNFSVYNRVLTDSEISTISNNNISAYSVLRYTFEDNTVLPSYYGNAENIYNSDFGSTVLNLDGTNGTYAEIPQGFFDGKDCMTVSFDVKSNSSGGNFFTFGIGKDSTQYDFFRIRGSEIRNAITVNSYYNERDVKTNVGFGDSWINIALVFQNTLCTLYVNGEKVDSADTGIKISDFGTDILSYFGKSFYDGDSYFKGCFDNFEVYDYALQDEVIYNKAVSRLPLLIGINIGATVSNLDGISGYDNHTSVKTEINRQNGTVTSYVQRRQNIKAVPVSVYALNSDCKMYVDGEIFGGVGLLDLSYDRTLTLSCENSSESYTIKAVSIANNPVLPGMFADPDIDVLDGKFWIFPTTDGTPGWGGTQFHAFSSPDMVHWTDEGIILDNKDKNPALNEKGVQIASCVWSDGNAWAPTVEEKNGRYYFYFCGRILEEYESEYGQGMAIGVASADSPAGPYYTEETPILYPKMMERSKIGFWGQVIDPAIYTEGNDSYILFGNGGAAIAKLNSAMTRVDTTQMRVINGLDEFRESVAVFKRGDLYYYTWSCDDTGSENYHINYGTATSLEGNVTYRGTLVQKDVSSGILATGHQSVIYLPENDRCFIAYHRFYTPLSIGGNVGHRRETCIDEITFDSNNLMNTVTPSYEGVNPVDIYGFDIDETITYPTCTEDGLITANNFTLTADEAPEVKASGHSFHMTSIAPGCSEKGYDLYRCSACGEEYKENFLPKLGHNLTVRRNYKSSDYSAHCSRCDSDLTFNFAEYLNVTENDSSYSDIIDINGDGIINGRDLAYFKTNAVSD